MPDPLPPEQAREAMALEFCESNPVCEKSCRHCRGDWASVLRAADAIGWCFVPKAPPPGLTAYERAGYEHAIANAPSLTTKETGNG